MNVCLVNPPPNAVQEPMYDTPIFVRPALACLGATLRDASIDCTLVDAKFERLSGAQVLDRVADSGPKVLGFTAFTNEIKPAAELAARAKERWPDVTTVVGGVHLSALPEGTLDEFPQFDVGCIGQGDQTIVELCRALEEDRSFESVNGLVWRQDGALRRSDPAPAPPFAELPRAAWDLMPGCSRYHVMTSRGCPYACNFCMNPNGRIVHPRSPEQIVDEVEWILSSFGPDDRINIWFDDEIFTINMKRVHEICDAFLAAGLERRIGWFAQTHVNVVDRDLLGKMRAAGCQRVGLGIESADQSVLRSMGKGSNVERIAKAARAAEDVGMPLETYFIIGHPNETVQSARNTVDFAVRINPEIPIFGIMVPYPGTSVARKAETGEDGYRLRTTDWNEYNKQIGGALEFEHLSRFELEWIQTSGYLKVFWANRRFADLFRFVWTYRTQGFTILRKWLRSPLGALRGSREESAEPLRAITAPAPRAD